MIAIELEEKVTKLQERVARLERTVWHSPGKRLAFAPSPDRPLDKQALTSALKEMNIIRDPLPEEKALAGEWRCLPEEEKRAHIQFMQSLTLEPPLSQIIIENRR